MEQQIESLSPIREGKFRKIKLVYTGGQIPPELVDVQTGEHIIGFQEMLWTIDTLKMW